MKARLAAVSAVAMLPLIALGATTPTASARAAGPVVTVSVLPGIAQFGARPAAAGAAKGVVNVKITPRPKAGTAVTILAGTGTRLAKVGVARTNGAGAAALTTPVLRNGSPLKFKAVWSRAGKKPVASKVVSASRWAKPLFSEEFSGSALPAMFTHRMHGYNAPGMRACSKTGEAATAIGGGVANLSVMADPERTDKCAAYKNGVLQGHYAYRLNGHISTENTFAFKYGVAAARLKFPKPRGQHGGFWLQTTQAGTGAEIDIVEWFGQNSSGGVSSFTYHPLADGTLKKTGTWIKNPSSFLANKTDAFWKNYHVFSVEWTPREYIFRIDGKVSWRSKVGVSQVPEFLVLSMLSSDYEIPLANQSNIKQTMQADWVRVWQ